MKATTRLNVLPDMQVQVVLLMTIEEMRALLERTKDESGWPMWQLREVVMNSLAKADAIFVGEHETRK